MSTNLWKYALSNTENMGFTKSPHALRCRWRRRLPLKNIASLNSVKCEHSCQVKNLEPRWTDSTTRNLTNWSMISFQFLLPIGYAYCTIYILYIWIDKHLVSRKQMGGVGLITDSRSILHFYYSLPNPNGWLAVISDEITSIIISVFSIDSKVSVGKKQNAHWIILDRWCLRR